MESWKDYRARVDKTGLKQVVKDDLKSAKGALRSAGSAVTNFAKERYSEYKKTRSLEKERENARRSAYDEAYQRASLKYTKVKARDAAKSKILGTKPRFQTKTSSSPFGLGSGADPFGFAGVGPQTKKKGRSDTYERNPWNFM